MPEITLSNKVFTYSVFRKLVRSLSLRLKSRSSFTVSCPHLTPDFFIKKFINQHADWIIKNSTKFKSPRSLLRLSSLTILDQKYALNIHPAKHDSVIIFPDEHIIDINAKTKTSPHLKKILEPRLRRLALPLIRQELDNLCLLYHFKYFRLSLKNQKSLFGSCSGRNNLNFNWQIIFFPKDKFRHILLHELIHLEVKNHSRHYWETFGKYDPNWKANNLWLKKEGTKNFIIKP
ncbi:MAG: YgjP-like metallopeptidase domain-containing protein [Candidatus Shapirobacteria bacterium]|jgi:hypothetical protein